MSEAITTAKDQRNKIVLIGTAKRMRELVDSKPLMETFEKANPLGYARIVQSFLNACLKTPKLLECEQTSIIDAVVKAVSYGMETDGVMGRAYIIPRWNGLLNCNQANFQLGYKGLAELFYRAVPGGLIDGGYACENDEFDYQMGTTFKVELRKARGERGEISHFYAFYRLANGNTTGEVFTVEEMLDHCQEYRSDKSKVASNKNYRGIWDQRFDEMGVKTMVARVCKRAPMSPEAQKAITEDELMATGNFTIEQAGESVTDTTITSNQTLTPDVPQEPAKNGEPAKRSRIKLNKNQPASAGAPDAPAAGGTELSHAAAPTEAVKTTEEDPEVKARKEWADQKAQAATPEGRAAAANPAPTQPAAPQQPAGSAKSDAIPPPTPIDWVLMNLLETWETWSSFTQAERMAVWATAEPAVQAHIVKAAEKYKPKPAPPAAAAAAPDPNDPRAVIHQKATDLIKAMSSPQQQEAWVMGNRLNVASDQRAVMMVAAGIDPEIPLSRQSPDAVEKYAIKIAHYLITNGKPIVPQTSQSGAGRPGPR